ncbi:MAG: hypothetical protein DHS20C10_09880 [marine bacterium B5-7]|nr:MAG: hypothetical protein DHS20C10_09880 [marine bacterium B5-7]
MASLDALMIVYKFLFINELGKRLCEILEINKHSELGGGTPPADQRLVTLRKNRVSICLSLV